MPQEPSMLISNTSITVMFSNGETYSLTKTTNPTQFEQIKTLINNKDWGALQRAFNYKEKIVHESKGLVEIKEGKVYYKDVILHNTLTQRILDLITEGFNVDPMVKFLENLMQNPSKRAVDELYSFLEVGQLPITSDGCFMAYKKVRSDFKDLYSGTFDNSPGSICEMDRNMVDDRKENTCSQGLHFCSRSYLPKYGGDIDTKTVMVKINPADVVSIPADYNNTKGRTCKYEVIEELTGSASTPDRKLENEILIETPSEDEEYFDDEESSDYFEDEDQGFGEDGYSETPPTQNTSVKQVQQVRFNNNFYLITQQNIDEYTNLVQIKPSYKNTAVFKCSTNGTKHVPSGSTPSRYNLDEIYSSPTTAGDMVRDPHTLTFVNPSSISKVCNGKRKSAGNYHWVYAKDIISP